MDNLQNILEYYDELYPVSESQKLFYQEMLGDKMPAHVLRIGCSTGLFEHYLARLGHDVTGIETSKDMLETANRRRRMPNTAIRFFQMSSIEMTRFLGKGFYDVISCLNDRLLFIHDRTLLAKFFVDCKSLLAPNGKVVLEVPYFETMPKEGVTALSIRENIRVRLYTELNNDGNGNYTLLQDLEHHGSRSVTVLKDVPVLPVTPDDIRRHATNAGFTSVEFFSTFDKDPLAPDCSTLIALLQ